MTTISPTRQSWETVEQPILDIYKNAPDQQDIKGTAWGFSQAVSNFVDNHATYRGTDPENRDRSRAENLIIRTVLKGDTLADRVLELLPV